MAEKKKRGPFRVVIRLFGVLILLVVLVIGAAVIYGFTLDSKRTFKRSIVIDASESAIHEQVGDLKNWPEWGPWKDEDPTMQWTFSEDTDEVGSWMSWTSDKPRNNGRLEITSTDSSKGIEYKIQFDGSEQFPGAVRYNRTTEGVNVEWSVFMDMGNNVIMRLMMKAFEGSMNEMFDNGLKKLKAEAEK